MEGKTTLSSGSRRLLIRMSSSFLREMASSSASSDVYMALVSALRNVLTLIWYRIFVPGNEGFVVLKSAGDSSEDLESYLEWVLSKKTIAFTQTYDNTTVLFLPLVFKDEVKAILAGGIEETEVDVELQESLQLFSYLAASTLVNIELNESLSEKNRMIEEAWRFLNNLLDSFPDQVAVYDENGAVVFKNRAFDFQNLPSKCLAELEQAIKTASLTGEAVKREIECEDEHFYSLEVFPLDFGEHEYLLVRLDDITGSKELERLKKIDQLKMEFIANVSHEIRTPLAAIKAYAETMQYSIEELDPQTLKDFINTIVDQTLHLEEIVDELLDFSRIELGQLQLERSETDVVSLVKSVVNSLEKLAMEKDVEIRTNFDSEEILAYVDHRQFRKVVTNLVSNSIKYSDPSKPQRWVEVRLSQDDNALILEVLDNGIGMTHEESSKAFERFYRADTSLTYEVSGTGLGLSIVKEIVEAHGGEVSITSTKGEGTTVRVVIPK